MEVVTSQAITPVIGVCQGVQELIKTENQLSLEKLRSLMQNHYGELICL